jgi:uncharacterized NAD-dependent epimerase/dehydratase family protein
MLKPKVLVEHTRISKQVMENTETIASMAIVKDELLREFDKWEVVEDELKEQIKRWMDEYPEAYSLLKWILYKIEEIDKHQDEIIEKVIERVIKTLLNNQMANGLWKAYEPKGNYYKKAAFRAPLFDK